MRQINFPIASNQLKVVIDGVGVPGLTLDISQISAAKRAKVFSPVTRDALIQLLKKKLEKNGPVLRAEEIQLVMRKLTSTIDEA